MHLLFFNDIISISNCHELFTTLIIVHNFFFFNFYTKHCWSKTNCKLRIQGSQRARTVFFIHFCIGLKSAPISSIYLICYSKACSLWNPQIYKIQINKCLKHLTVLAIHRKPAETVGAPVILIFVNAIWSKNVTYCVYIILSVVVFFFFIF